MWTFLSNYRQRISEFIKKYKIITICIKQYESQHANVNMFSDQSWVARYHLNVWQMSLRYCIEGIWLD